MIFLYGTVFLGYFLLFFLSYSKKQTMANYVYEMLLKAKVFRQKDARENLLILHPETGGKEEKGENYLHQFYINKIGFFLLVIFAGNIIAVCLWSAGKMGSVLTEGKYISRNTYGMGSKEICLQVERSGSRKKTGQEIVITIEEQSYEEVLIRQMAKEIPSLLPDIIRGMNESVEEVRSNLNLVHEIEGYPFQISWESDNYACIYPDGTVMNEEIVKEGEIVNLTAVITYGDYREEHIFPVCVFPPRYSEEELWKKKLYEMLINQEEKNRCEERIELPESMGGEQLVWSEKTEDSSGYIFLLMCISAGAVYLLQERKLKEKIDERNRQMILDYPQLISKLVLYLGAGMTIRNAFQKIASHYNKERQKGSSYHYVYEEMLLTCHELESGISEASAYEHFGKRCRLQQYTKLSNILVQNLRKGSNGILNALRQETKNAFEERRNRARKMGEEAGTKLLVPMMLMLGIVMVLIMIPAYFSFSL